MSPLYHLLSAEYHKPAGIIKAYLLRAGIKSNPGLDEHTVLNPLCYVIITKNDNCIDSNSGPPFYLALDRRRYVTSQGPTTYLSSARSPITLENFNIHGYNHSTRFNLPINIELQREITKSSSNFPTEAGTKEENKSTFEQYHLRDKWKGYLDKVNPTQKVTLQTSSCVM